MRPLHPSTGRGILTNALPIRTPTSWAPFPTSARRASSPKPQADEPATAHLNPRWLSDLKSRLGKCIMFGLQPQQTQEAGKILRELSTDWRELLAGSEGFLTAEGRRGLFRQEVVWGDMVYTRLLWCGRGHVNNVMYNRYAESSRVNWTNNFANYLDPAHKREWSELLTPRGDGLILKSIRTDYKFPMKWPDRVTVLHKLRSKPELDTDSFILDVIILSELHRRPAARCVEDIVVYDYKRGKKTPLRPFMVEQFKETFRLQEEAKRKNGDRVKYLLDRKSSRRNAPSSHDKRHEGGLANPGKRIQKQRSNPSIDSASNGKAQSPTPPLPPADVNQHTASPAVASDDTAHATVADNKMPVVEGSPVRPHPDARARNSSEASIDGPDVSRATDANGTPDPTTQGPQRRMADGYGAKSSTAYKGSVFTLATTILSSCPLRDVIAILILLLQLPPTVLTIIHLLFTILTFVPPSSGASFASLPSLSDLSVGSAGTPSVTTVLLIDLIVFGLWMCIPLPAENVALDFAQAAIAISLGGAAAGKGGTTNSIVLCTVIILFSHFFRSRRTSTWAASFCKRREGQASQQGKKRRQANQVRSQQPFWAAVASTKVTVYKEMEQSQSATDASEANATDMQHIGNANFRLGEDRVWISEVEASTVSFGLSLSRRTEVQEGEEVCVNVAGIDKSKPFYVRLNGAGWGSTNIQHEGQSDCPGEENVDVWSGEIFGLTPLTSYLVEFVRFAGNEVIFSAHLITPPAPHADQASAAVPPPRQSLRPSSPTTTVKMSIAATEQKVQDARNRLKRNRKDHKTGLASVKKEVDNLNNRLSSSGGNDERQRQRAMQFNQSIRQAEETASSLTAQIDDLGDIPADELTASAAKRRSWQQATGARNSAAEELDRAKAESDRQTSAIQSEINAALQKRDRLQARQEKLTEQHDRLCELNAQDLMAKERRAASRAQKRASHAAEAKNMVHTLESVRAEIVRTYEHRAQIQQQIYHLEAIYSQSQMAHSVPTTPEGPLPGTTGNRAFGVGFQFPATVPAQYAGQPAASSSHLREGRGRSSSMFSNASGYTDQLEDLPAQPQLPISPPAASVYANTNGARLADHANSNGDGAGRNGSVESRSGSTSSSASQRDPISPPQKTVGPSLLSPIGSNAVKHGKAAGELKQSLMK
ncbi:hypothetical protein H2199_002052 [Coniosporium tulheliwenetii]|uniref:Uncharacterized protein n=1 Tax=Coniosporium tulheliwenetii TaxID=3383036 RepID=A0ACC2ZH02_9PEZI|nr:hypothetical protein H2199_002052 [Cladosporium sp. JES 115]